jgi:hypothetical protein
MSLGIFRTIGLVIFMYLLWRDLRDDYGDQKIINYAWLAMLGFLFGGRIAYGLIHWGVWNDNWLNWLAIWSKPGTNYLGSYIGLVLVSWLMSSKNQWKFLSLMDDIVKPTLIFTCLLMIDEWVRTNFFIKSFIYLILLVFDVFLVNWLKKKYRSFIWYKSGRKGFVLLFNNFLFFLAIFIVLILIKDNWISMILALIISLISGIGLYILKKEKI